MLPKLLKKILDPTGFKELEKILKNKKHEDIFPIVVLTGAGISKESGIETFRGTNGLWEGHRIEEVCRPEGFDSNPELVWSFYNLRRELAFNENVKPNAGHTSLKQIQDLEDVYIITQNVDNLHEQAGSSVVHMHGDLQRNRCHECKNVFSDPRPLSVEITCPQCQKQGTTRPNVVFFKETPLFGNYCLRLVSNCKTFIAIGTSGIVYPAAHYVVYAKQQKALTIEINPVETANSFNFDLKIKDTASSALPKLFNILKNKKTKS